jgi:hypothetical protein
MNEDSTGESLGETLLLSLNEREPFRQVAEQRAKSLLVNIEETLDRPLTSEREMMLRCYCSLMLITAKGHHELDSYRDTALSVLDDLKNKND